MDRRLLRPRWLLAHAVVLAVAVVFVSLGFWQLGRLEERQLENELGEQRLNSEPAPIDVVLESTDHLDSLQYRRVTVTGEFDPANEVLIRSQVYQASAGFHVITPLVPESGEAVLVNRGWVPLNFDEVPVTEAPPPSGTVTVEGWVEPTQERPTFGPQDPGEGRLVALNRVDVGRIEQQAPMSLAPVYVVEIAEQTAEPPVPVEPPDFEDEGPHLAYAIQWFGFTIIGLVGYYALARRQLRQSA